MSVAKPLFPDISVNGTAISAADIAAEAQNHNAPKSKPGWAWKSAARALVIRELLLLAAQEWGLAPAPKELAPGKTETNDEALIRALLEAGVIPETPTEAAMAALYKARPDAFRAPTLYEPAHILFAADVQNEDAREEAVKKASAALATLAAQPQAFASLAQEISDCPSREAGGHLGQLVSGDTVPEFEAAMDAMNQGEIMPEPLATRYGVHILRMDAKVVGDVLPYERVKPQISEMLEKANWAKAANAFVATLVEKADITGIDMTT